MHWTVIAALAAAPLLTAVTVAWHRIRTLRRALAAERAQARLKDACHHRDMSALRARLHEVRLPAAVLAAADYELTQALAYYAITDSTEGGSR